MPVKPVLRKLRQEDYMFESSLCYVVKPCLKKQKQEPRVAPQLDTETDNLAEYLLLQYG